MRTLSFALVAVLAACSGAGGGTVSVSTTVTGAAVAAAPTALAVGDRVTLDRARFLIRKVALEAEAADSGTSGTTSLEGTPSDVDSPDSSSDETVVRWGPLVIDLSGATLDGGVRLELQETVPAGTWDELTFQLHKLTPGESVTDADFTPLGPSILLDLKVDGEPFVFRSDLTAVAEIAGPFTVPDGGSVNVTVTVDPSGWFKDAAGAFLDPRVEANRPAIEQNLRASIRGFEDDDHDGKPDVH